MEFSVSHEIFKYSGVMSCRALLTDDSADIFERYRALFALRNLGGDGAVEALGASFASDSALLKHEVAYVLGQMQNKEAVQTLRHATSSFVQLPPTCLQ